MTAPTEAPKAGSNVALGREENKGTSRLQASSRAEKRATASSPSLTKEEKTESAEGARGKLVVVLTGAAEAAEKEIDAGSARVKKARNPENGAEFDTHLRSDTRRRPRKNGARGERKQ